MSICPTGIFPRPGRLLGSTLGAHWMNRLSGSQPGPDLRSGPAGGRDPHGDRRRDRSRRHSDSSPLVSFALVLLIGAITGLLSGLAGVGGGSS